MSAGNPANASLIEALGDIARRGRSGRLLFSRGRGVKGGFLAFTKGLLRSAGPPEGSGWKPSARRDRDGVRAEVMQLCAGAAAADPGFVEAEAKDAPAGHGLSAAEIAIALSATLTDEAWLTRTLLDGPERLLGRPEAPAAAPPAEHALQGPVASFLVMRSAASPASNALRQVIAASPGSSLATLQAIFALRAAGVIAIAQRGHAASPAPDGERSDVPASPPVPPGPAAAPRRTSAAAPKRTIIERVRPASSGDPSDREELLARCRDIERLDYYAMLGIGQRSTEAEIRAAYYGIARRFHPDKVRKPHLEDLLPQAERMFAAVTEAYNHLSNAGRRAEYDRTLIEIASGRKTPDAREQQAQARDLFLRGKRHYEAKQLFEALGYLEAAVKADPSRAEYFHYLGACQSHNPKWRKKAEENLLKAVEMNPGSYESYRLLARIYRRGGLATRSQEMFRKVLEWDPQDEEALEAVATMDDGGKSGGGLLGSLFGRS